MSYSAFSSQASSLENIQEEGSPDDVEASLSSRVSSTTDARTMATPRSLRSNRRPNVNVSSFITSRLESFDDNDDLPPVVSSPRVGGNGPSMSGPVDEWVYGRLDINMPPHFTMTDVDLSPTNLRTGMKDLITDSRYWIKLVDRLGYDKKVYDTESIPTLDTLSRYYDSSDMGLLRVFHLFDTDKDRLMSKNEMIVGLSQQGFGVNPDSQVAKSAMDDLFDLISSGSSDASVSPLEFLLALKSLRLAAILHPFSLLSETRRNVVASREMDIHFHEYREDHVTISRPLSDPIDFLFHVDEMPDPKTSRVQWIHCHEASRRTVLAIAIQFGLDPRYVLDVFTLWREQAKADRVRDLHDTLLREKRRAAGIHVQEDEDESTEWVFLVVPVIRLTTQSKEALEPHFEWRRAQKISKDKSAPVPDVNIEVEACNMAVFVTGVRGKGTVITFTSEWVGLCKFDVCPLTKEDRDFASGLTPSRVTKFFRSVFCRGDEKPEPISRPPRVYRNVDTEEMMAVKRGSVTLSVSDSDLDMFPRVLKLIDTSYSHIRTGDAFTLVLKSISDICEDYVKIIDAYEAAIDILNKKVTVLRSNLSEDDVKLIQRGARHLSKLYRSVRPLTSVVEILSLQKDWGGEAALYVSEIQSNVNRCLSDSAALIETAELLKQNHVKYGKARTGSVLYYLTLVTVIFTPAEFLATVYGMNFKVPPAYTQFASPELNWRFGYLYFWCVVVALVTVVFTLYKKKSWI